MGFNSAFKGLNYIAYVAVYLFSFNMKSIMFVCDLYERGARIMKVTNKMQLYTLIYYS